MVRIDPEAVDQSVDSSGVRLRTFKSRAGHIVQLIDSDQSEKKGVRVRTAAGHEIHLNDSDQYIEVKTPGGHTLKLDDRGRSIQMKSTGKIEMEAPQEIVLKSASSKITVNPQGVTAEGLQAVVKGTGQAKLEGAIVNVSAQGVASVKGATLQLG